ncbi:MAG: hypothetical protein AAF958_03865 [Planctomycetota bacterium]
MSGEAPAAGTPAPETDGYRLVAHWILMAKCESTAERSKPVAGGKRTEPRRAFVPPPETVTLALDHAREFGGGAAEFAGVSFGSPITGGGVWLA